jgi:hypothetical protein
MSLVVTVLMAMPVPVPVPVATTVMVFVLLPSLLHPQLPAQVFLLLHLPPPRAEPVLPENAVNVGLLDHLTVQFPKLLVGGVVLGYRTQLGTPVLLLRR